MQDTAPALDLLDRFVAKSAAAGTGRTAADVPFFRYMYVAETMEQARADVAAHLEWVLDMLLWRGYFQNGGSEIYHRIDDWRAVRDQTPRHFGLRPRKPSHSRRPRPLHSAASKQLKARGVRYLGANFAMGGLDGRKVLKSMELFAREVMPAVGMPES